MKLACRITIMTILLLLVLFLVAAGWDLPAAVLGVEPDFPPGDIVVFVGHREVDLMWDPVACDYYEVLKNGTPMHEAGYLYETETTTGRKFFRDDQVSYADVHTYQVCAVTGSTRDCSIEQVANVGFVKGTLYEDLKWINSGIIQLDGPVLVKEYRFLDIEGDVSIERGISPSGATGIETESGLGGLRVSAAGSSPSFSNVHLWLNAVHDAVRGAEGNPVRLTNVDLLLTNATPVEYCEFQGASHVTIQQVLGTPTLSHNQFGGTAILIRNTSTPVEISDNRFGDPVMGEITLRDGAKADIRDNVFVASSGTGIDVGDGTATIEGNTFTIAGTIGVRVWPMVGAQVTIRENLFETQPVYMGVSGVVMTEDTQDPEPPGIGDWSNVTIEDNLFVGRAPGRFSPAVLVGGGVNLEMRYNSIVLNDNGVLLFSAGGLGNITMNGNCIAANENGILMTLAPGESLNVAANWWGSSTGPSHPDNPDGRGDEIDVLDGDINYSPWLQADNCAAEVRNLKISGMEVVQVVQSIDNQVPLVENKPAAVRVYPCSVTGDVSGVTGELTVTRGGAELGVLRPLRSVSASKLGGDCVGLYQGEWEEVRTDPNQGLVFKVPASWVTGTLTFTAEINPDRTIPESDFADNSATKKMTPIPGPSVKVGVVPTNYNPAEYDVRAAPTLDSVLAIHELFEKLYPSADVRVHLLPAIDWPHELSGAGLYPKYQYPAGALLNLLSLSQMRLQAEGTGADAEPDLVYGAFDPSLYLYQYESPFYTRNKASFATNYQNLFAYTQMIHLGVFGLPSADPSSVSGSLDEVGYDVTTDRVVGLGTGMQSVTSPREDITDPDMYWIGREDYERLIASGAGMSESQPLTDRSAQTYLAVSGSIRATDEIELLPAWQFTSLGAPQNPPPGADYCVELRDSGEGVLQAQCFDLYLPFQMSWGQFLVSFPLTGEPARIVVRRGDVELGEIPVSSQPPAVSINARTALGSTSSVLELAWTASDQDGDALEYSVQYSPDDGDSWLPVATNLDNSAYVLNLDEVPGGTQARVRVEASDGFHVGRDEYGPFVVPDHAPILTIQRPEHESIISTTVSLSGFAYDYEDGELEGIALEWSSDRDGILGSGSTLKVSGISTGTHQLSLTATDSQGNANSESILVHVGQPSGPTNPIYLPLVMRNSLP